VLNRKAEKQAGASTFGAFCFIVFAATDKGIIENE